MLRTELDEFLCGKHIGKVEFGWTVADATAIAEMHERRELLGEVIEGLVGHSGPIGIGLSLLIDSSLLRNDIYGKWKFTYLCHEVFSECGVLLLFALHMSQGRLQDVFCESHSLEVFLRNDAEKRL